VPVVALSLPLVALKRAMMALCSVTTGITSAGNGPASVRSNIFRMLEAHVIPRQYCLSHCHMRGVSQDPCDMTGMSQSRPVTPTACCSGLLRYDPGIAQSACHMPVISPSVLSHSESAVIAWCDMMIVSQPRNISGVLVIACGLIRWRTVQ
jgi:hypothetical protein